MDTVTAPAVEAVSKGRRLAFTILLGLLAVSTIAFGAFSLVGGAVGLAEERQEHRLHDVVGGVGLLLMLGLPAATMFRNAASKVAPMQLILVYMAASVLAMALSGEFSPFAVPFLIVTLVLAALHPARGRLSSGGGDVSWPVVALTVVAAVPLVAYALTQIDIQRTDDVSLHDEEFHWATQASTAFSLVLGGLVVAVRPAGARIVAWLLGASAVAVGAASLGLPDLPSALEGSWAWATIAGGALLVALAEWDARRTPAPLRYGDRG